MINNSLNVYITTYNRSKYLKICLESIIAQTYKSFDIYVLDNCSDDDTEQVVNSCSDERIHYIRHESNIGGVPNINYAFDHNEADYFVIFHDDDVMSPEMLETEINYMVANPDISLVSSISGHVDENGEWLEAAKSSMELMMDSSGVSEVVYRNEEFFRSYLYEGANIVFPSVMYRNSFVKDNKLKLRTEAGPSCDTELMFEICRSNGNIAILNCALMNTRMHKGQDSFQYFGTMYEKLFTYMRNDSYFSNLLNKYRSGCDKLYSNLSKIIAVYMIRGKFSVAQANENEKSIWNSIGGRWSDRLKYKCVETAYGLMPKTVSAMTDRYLSRKR